MENNIDKLFRDGLSQKGTPFNEEAWDRLALPEQEKKRRVGFWWWFGLAALLVGLIAWSILRKEHNPVINEPVKKEFAAESNPQNEDIISEPDKGIDSGLTGIIGKDGELQSIENHDSEKIAGIEAKEKQENEISERADNYEIIENEKEVNSDLSFEESTLRNEIVKPGKEAVINDDVISETRAIVMISYLNNPVKFLNAEDRTWDRRLSDEYRIEPLQVNNKWVVSGLVEASQVGRIGGGIALSWKGDNRMFFRSAILYNYQSEDDRLIAIERIASYGFGRSISERQFRSQHLHMISIPVNVGLSQGSWDGYGGVRADYLSGVRGVVSVDSESSVTSVNSWMKEYGYNRISLDIEMGLMKSVNRNLGLGLRIGYPILSRYNVDYFNNSNLQLENKRDINISLQLQYDLIR
ncbi:MAG: hypothetical protein HKN68_16835 [Saprospiraceae bacterium]|nr:hypothetical protein [Saprospiraceae bacterium]